MHQREGKTEREQRSGLWEPLYLRRSRAGAKLSLWVSPKTSRDRESARLSKLHTDDEGDALAKLLAIYSLHCNE